MTDTTLACPDCEGAGTFDEYDRTRETYACSGCNGSGVDERTASIAVALAARALAEDAMEQADALANLSVAVEHLSGLVLSFLGAKS